MTILKHIFTPWQRYVDAKVDAVHQKIDALRALEVEVLRDQIAAHEREIAVLKERAGDLESETKRLATTGRFPPSDASAEPWVEIYSESFDPTKGIKLELDWNDAFIQYLRDNGITGIDEDTIVQKWLAVISLDLSQQLENTVIDRDGEAMPYA